MKKENWIWMPHAGHFILGSKCQFHLNTYVGKFIVSTVGELWNERCVREIHAGIWDKDWLIKNKSLKGDNFDRSYMERFGYDEIGCDRKYETMVFVAKRDKENKCCPWRIDSSHSVDFEAEDSADKATIAHKDLCVKWSKIDKIPEKEL